MSDTFVTPMMKMTLPVPGARPGPQWSVDLNTTGLGVVDTHDHSTGKGVQVTPAGLNISADLSFVSNNATDLRSTRFTSQLAALAGVKDLGCAYVVANDLYFNDGIGTQIRITSGGGLNVAGLSSSVWPVRIVTTDVTILPADTYISMLIDTTAVRNITLPASSGVTAGRFYWLDDTSGLSETNSITLLPAGTDKIDGVNANIVLRSNNGRWAITTDALGNWYLIRSASELNAASVPKAGALTTGNLLQVSGSRSLTYAALNLAGGAGYVTGVLPAPNLGLATTSQSGAVQLAGDFYGTATVPRVGGVTAILALSMGIVARASTGAPVDVVVYGQDAFSGGGATAAAGGAITHRSGASFGAVGGDANVSGKQLFKVGPNALLCLKEIVTSRNVAAFFIDPASVDLGAGTGNNVIAIANANVEPTVGQAAAALLYSSGGALGVQSGVASGARVIWKQTLSGAAGALSQYLIVNVNGTDQKIPLYAV